MRQLMVKLWKDECGAAAQTVELVFIITILVLGVTVGLAGLRAAVNNELSELAGAIMALNQSYSFAGQSNCLASSAGSGASDVCDLIPIRTTSASVCNVDDDPCD